MSELLSFKKIRQIGESVFLQVKYIKSFMLIDRILCGARKSTKKFPNVLRYGLFADISVDRNPKCSSF